MDQLPRCSLACPAGQVCVSGGKQQSCLPKCPDSSNLVATPFACGCQTARPGRHAFVQALKYCVNGVASSRPQCADHTTPTSECYCATATNAGCANYDSLCYLGRCYYADCSAGSYRQDYACKCGNQYIYAGEFCVQSHRFNACAKHYLVSNCGCALSGLEICGESAGMHVCEAGTCRELAECANNYLIDAAEECGCCAGGACTLCGAGSTCANGACLCPETDSYPNAVDSPCVCGTQQCEHGQHCHRGKCYDLIATGAQNPADSGKETLCRGRNADGAYVFGLIMPESYCTAAGLPSTSPMCPPYGSLVDGPCVCSKTTVEICEIRITGTAPYNCLQRTFSKQSDYLCLPMCEPSANPVSSQCVCSLDQGIAEIGDFCLAVQSEVRLFSRCTLKHFQTQTKNDCFCGSLSQLCSIATYCGAEKKCVAPPRCEEGVVRQEFCQTQQGLCQGGNYLDRGQCFCAVDQPIVAAGASCVCGASPCASEAAGQILYCVNKRCLPACVGDERPEARLCGCVQGSAIAVAGPGQALRACAPYCGAGFYFDAVYNHCLACAAACAECTALGCTKCARRAEKLENGLCVSQTNKLTIFVAIVTCAAVLVAVGVVCTVFALKKRARTRGSRARPHEMKKTGVVVEETDDGTADAAQ